MDLYDLVLFSIVRVASLRELGVPDDQLLQVGVRLLNMQMICMLLGGLQEGRLGRQQPKTAGTSDHGSS